MLFCGVGFVVSAVEADAATPARTVRFGRKLDNDGSKECKAMVFGRKGGAAGYKGDVGDGCVYDSTLACWHNFIYLR